MKFRSGKDNRKSIGLTIFQNGFAAITEMRSLSAESAIDQVMIVDLPAQIEADSVYIKGLSVLEQSFRSGQTQKSRCCSATSGAGLLSKTWSSGKK